MIHGHKKEKKVKTEEQIKQEQELSNKINSKLSDFFLIRSKPFTNQQIPKYLQFTALLMQLCSDISTIFNFRREILLKYLEINESSQAQILSSNIKLTTKLIKDDPKSYTLWSYRQWLIQKLYKLNKKIVDQQKMLCKMLLMKDQKNFHVWNYRNWVNSIQFRVDQQLAFTQQKIKNNPFNFSPYHFRSKYLSEKYLSLMCKQNNELQEKVKKQVLTYGMPKSIFQQQLQKIKTAIFLNPNQEAPWIYYRWLMRRTLPVVILKSQVKENGVQITLNQKIQKQQLSKFVTDKEAILQYLKGSQTSHIWFVNSQSSFQESIKQSSNIYQEICRESFITCQSGVKKFTKANSQKNQIQLNQLRSFYLGQIQFMKQIQIEEQNCRFAFLEHLELIKLIILLKENKQKQILIQAVQICQKLLQNQQIKTKQYIEQLLYYWKNVSNRQN